MFGHARVLRQVSSRVGLDASAIMPPGGYTVRNLVGQNNTTTPTTQYDLTSASLVQLRNPTDGSTVSRTAVGLLTNNILTAGPAANGRDQAAAFPAAIQAIHFYYIWNGTTLATLSSLTGIPTGPALPTGYTHWAYATTVMTNAVPNLSTVRTLGAWVLYPTEQFVVASGTATVETTVSLASFVPALASVVQIDTNLGESVVVTGSGSDQLIIRVVTGVNALVVWTLNSTTGGANNGSSTGIIPNLGQSLFYLISRTSTGGTIQASIAVMGYRIPNGDS